MSVGMHSSCLWTGCRGLYHASHQTVQEASCASSKAHPGRRMRGRYQLLMLRRPIVQESASVACGRVPYPPQARGAARTQVHQQCGDGEAGDHGDDAAGQDALDRRKAQARPIYAWQPNAVSNVAAAIKCNATT